ncbi:MAG TPA: hypothetical protein VF174_01915 [Micromonosporaceae bacterium]
MSSQKRSTRNGVILAIILASVALAVTGVILGSSDDLAVPGPDPTEAADTVTVLRRAAQEQGICYGWELANWSEVVDVGSNLGSGVAVDSDPVRCPRWVKVIANIRYTAESSESEDSATVWVESTEGATAGFPHRLAGLGLDEATFIDEPGWAVTRAAVTLPLLMVEAGLAPAGAVSTQTPEAVPSPSPLPEAGSDLWRDRWGYLVTGALLLLTTVLFVSVGFALRARQRDAATVAGAPVTGKAKAGRG